MKGIDSAKEICSLLQDAGFEAVFAGGCVRDCLIGVDYNDIDIATSAPSEEVMKILFSNGIKSKYVGESFSVCLTRHNGFLFEIATFRKDIDCDGRHPASIEISTMEEDAKRRDFTINAVFYDPIKNIYHDFVGGINDIKERKLRFVGCASERLQEDYIRALRFLRFWGRGFIPDEETIKVVNDLSPMIADFIAPERISKEIMEKIFYEIDSISFMFKILHTKLPNLLKTIFPEVYATIGVPQNPKFHPEGDVFNHTMKIIGHLAFLGADEMLLLAGLYHDVGKAITTTTTNGEIKSHNHDKASVELTKAFMERNRFSNSTIQRVCGIIEDHMKLHYDGMKDSSLRRIMAKPYFEDLLLHTYADCLASDGDISILENYSGRMRTLKNNFGAKLPDPLITGSSLMQLGMKPNPEFKHILEEAYELQLEGKFSSEEEGKKIIAEKYSVK